MLSPEYGKAPLRDVSVPAGEAKHAESLTPEEVIGPDG